MTMPSRARGSCCAGDLAVGDVAAGDVADLWHLDDVADFRLTLFAFFDVRREQTAHCSLDIVDGFVDDAVGFDVDLFLFSQLFRVGIRAHVEADDDGIGCCRKADVGLADTTDGGADDVDAHFVGAELFEGLADRFDGALGVCFGVRCSVPAHRPAGSG